MGPGGLAWPVRHVYNRRPGADPPSDVPPPVGHHQQNYRTMTKRLGVGFVGSGFITRFHIQSFVGIRDADVLGVWSPNAKNAADQNQFRPNQIRIDRSTPKTPKQANSSK